MKIKFLLLSGEFKKKVYAKPRFNYCKLCLMEKLYINNSFGVERLNDKSEFVSKCRH